MQRLLSNQAKDEQQKQMAKSIMSKKMLVFSGGHGNLELYIQLDS